MAEQRTEIQQDIAPPPVTEAHPALQHITGMIGEVQQHRARIQARIKEGMSTNQVARELDATALSFLEDMMGANAALWEWLLTEALPDIDLRLQDVEQPGLTLDDEDVEKAEQILATARVHCEKLLEWNDVVPVPQRLDEAGIENVRSQMVAIDEMLARFAEDDGGDDGGDDGEETA